MLAKVENVHGMHIPGRNDNHKAYPEYDSIVMTSLVAWIQVSGNSSSRLLFTKTGWCTPPTYLSLFSPNYLQDTFTNNFQGRNLQKQGDTNCYIEGTHLFSIVNHNSTLSIRGTNPKSGNWLLIFACYIEASLFFLIPKHKNCFKCYNNTLCFLFWFCYLWSQFG